MTKKFLTPDEFSKHVGNIGKCVLKASKERDDIYECLKIITESIKVIQTRDRQFREQYAKNEDENQEGLIKVVEYQQKQIDSLVKILNRLGVIVYDLKFKKVK